MSRDEILKKATEIVIEQLGVDPNDTTPTANIVNDLNADSLDCVELVMSVEEEFGLAIPEGDAEKLQTINDAVDYLISRGV
jgi:acyl carrier protein